MSFFGMAVGVPPSVRSELAMAVQRALAHAEMKQETLARLMGITPPQLAQQLADGHPSLARLVMVATDRDGRAFWRALMPELASMTGVEDIDAIAAHLAKAVQLMDARRMVKVGSDTSTSERTKSA